MTKIILLGTNHADILGSSALYAALQKEKPDFVTVETNETMRVREDARDFCLDFICGIESAGKTLTGDQKERLREYLARIEVRGFEWNTAKSWAATNQVSIRQIGIAFDDSKNYTNGLQRAIGSFVEREQSNDFYLPDATTSRLKTIRANYYREQMFLFRHPMHAKKIVDSLRARNLIGYRDERMARRIKRIVAYEKPTVLMHIGGCGHMLADREDGTLLEHLRELKPARRLLSDYL